MKNTLLGVIAVCLFMITLKLYVPEANAESSSNNSYDLRYDYDFKSAVRSIAEDVIEDCSVTGYVDDDYLYSSSIDC